MGLLDIFKKKEPSTSNVWTGRLDDFEQIIQPGSFDAIIDEALTKIEENDAEFFVLSPSVPIHNFTFLQVCRDNTPGFMHIEVGLNEKLENGRPKILAYDKITTGEAMDLFIKFHDAQTINTDEWYLLT